MTTEHRYYMSLRNKRYVFHEDFLPKPNNCTQVAVIDFEDMEQVERLGDLLIKSRQDHGGIHLAAVRAALREFANPTPPKPRRQDALTEYRDEKTGRQYFVSAAPEFEAAETDLKRMAIAEVVIDSYGVAKNRKGWLR